MAATRAPALAAATWSASVVATLARLLRSNVGELAHRGLEARALQAYVQVVGLLVALGLAPASRQENPEAPSGGLPELVGARHLHVEALVADFLTFTSHV